MDFEGLYDILPYVAVIGSIVGIVLYKNSRYNNRPVVEGEVLESDFWNGSQFNKKDYSTVKIRSENSEEVYLSFHTGPKHSELFSYLFNPKQDSYEGKSEELSGRIPIGSTIKVKVLEKEGLERKVINILNVFPKDLE